LNTATGVGALIVSNGTDNTADGVSSLVSNTSGSQNTAVGSGALYDNTTGIGNTAIGYLAGVNAPGNYSNATAIGYNARVNAGNKIRLGNSAVTVIEGQVAYTFPSDGRFKTAITESVKGLEFIMKLRPVIYNFQTQKYDAFINGGTNERFASKIDYTESENIRHNGFIAQEVEKAAKETGYEFDGVIAPKNAKEAYGISYSQFVVPLVKAVQEQQVLSELKKKLNYLKAALKNKKRFHFTFGWSKVQQKLQRRRKVFYFPDGFFFPTAIFQSTTIVHYGFLLLCSKYQSKYSSYYYKIVAGKNSIPAVFLQNALFIYW
jgi:hypothetical protein